MFKSNHYLDLFHSKSSNEIKSQMLQIAMMHNALGVVLKDLFGRWRQPSQANTKPNTSTQTKVKSQTLVLIKKQEKPGDEETEEQMDELEDIRSQPQEQIQILTKFERATQQQKVATPSISQERMATRTEMGLSGPRLNPNPFTSLNQQNHMKNRRLQMLPMKKQKQVSNYDQNKKQNMSNGTDSDNDYNNSVSSFVSKPAVYREGLKFNKDRFNLDGYGCQMCQSFYQIASGENGNKKLCNHSRHRTTAPYSKINSFTQEFDDL